MEAAGFFETLVPIYQAARCHISEDWLSFTYLGCRIDVTGGGGGGGVLGGQRGELSDLIFWVVTPRSAVDIAEQSAASKWSSGREEKKGRKRGRFTRGGVSSLSAHSAV